ncbi:hypothetical protein HK098_003491 [Nowakowskiella sp. JEL0407]|nr:hypothetical protein HK098_003491 [Nowakowskiella sp. JEL0407]
MYAEESSSEESSSDSSISSIEKPLHVIYHDTDNNIDVKLDSEDLENLSLFHSNYQKAMDYATGGKGLRYHPPASDEDDSDESLINIGRDRKKNGSRNGAVSGRKSSQKRGNYEDDNPATKPVYCICRRSDDSEFMVGCDGCEEWFHGNCVGMTPEMMELVPEYYCPICRKSQGGDSTSGRGVRTSQKNDSSKRTNGKANGTSSKAKPSTNDKKQKKKVERSDDSDDELGSPMERIKMGLGKGKGLPLKRLGEGSKSGRPVVRGRSPFELDDICPVCDGECDCNTSLPVFSTPSKKKFDVKRGIAKSINFGIGLQFFGLGHPQKAPAFIKSEKLSNWEKSSSSSEEEPSALLPQTKKNLQKKKKSESKAKSASNKSGSRKNRTAATTKKNSKILAHELKLQKDSEIDLEDGMEYLIDIEGDEDEKIVAVGAISSAVSAKPRASFGGKGFAASSTGTDGTNDSDDSASESSEDSSSSNPYDSDSDSSSEGDNVERYAIVELGDLGVFSEEEDEDEVHHFADEEEIVENFIASQIYQVWSDEEGYEDEELEDHMDHSDDISDSEFMESFKLLDAKPSAEKNEQPEPVSKPVADFKSLNEVEDIGVVLDRNEFEAAKEKDASETIDTAPELNSNLTSVAEEISDDGMDIEDDDEVDMDVSSFFDDLKDSMGDGLSHDQDLDDSKLGRNGKTQGFKLRVANAGGNSTKMDENAQCLSFDIKKTHLGPNGEIITTTKSLTLQVGPQQMAKIVAVPNANTKINGNKKKSKSMRKDTPPGLGMPINPNAPNGLPPIGPVVNPPFPFLPFPIPQQHNHVGHLPPPFPFNIQTPPTPGSANTPAVPNPINIPLAFAAMTNLLKNFTNPPAKDTSKPNVPGNSNASMIPPNHLPNPFLHPMFPGMLPTNFSPANAPANFLSIVAAMTGANPGLFPPKPVVPVDGNNSKDQSSTVKEEPKSAKKKGKEKETDKDTNEELPPPVPFAPPPEFMKIWEDISRTDPSKFNFFNPTGLHEFNPPDPAIASAIAAATLAALAASNSNIAVPKPNATPEDTLASLLKSGTSTTANDEPAVSKSTQPPASPVLSSPSASPSPPPQKEETPPPKPPKPQRKKSSASSQILRTPHAMANFPDVVLRRKRNRNSTFMEEEDVEPTINIDDLVDTDQFENDMESSGTPNNTPFTTPVRASGSTIVTPSRLMKNISSMSTDQSDNDGAETLLERLNRVPIGAFRRSRRHSGGWNRRQLQSAIRSNSFLDKNSTIETTFVNETTPPPLSPPESNNDLGKILPEEPSSVVRNSRKHESSFNFGSSPQTSPFLKPYFGVDYHALDQDNLGHNLGSRKRKRTKANDANPIIGVNGIFNLLTEPDDMDDELTLGEALLTLNDESMLSDDSIDEAFRTGSIKKKKSKKNRYSNSSSNGPSSPHRRKTSISLGKSSPKMSPFLSPRFSAVSPRFGPTSPRFGPASPRFGPSSPRFGPAFSSI